MVEICLYYLEHPSLSLKMLLLANLQKITGGNCVSLSENYDTLVRR